jgi:hypothetical protein
MTIAATGIPVATMLTRDMMLMTECDLGEKRNLHATRFENLKI